MHKSVDANNFRSAVFEQFARIGKAVSSPIRLELLDILTQGPHTVEVLANALDQSVANTSQHLQVLRSANLVTAHKEGLYVTYSLADDAVSDFFRSLRRLAESHLAEVRTVTADFLGDRGMLEEVDRETLLARMQSGEVVVIDLRTVGEFETAHIPGALSIPARQLQQRLAELPADSEIVAYCRGPYCIIGIEAVELLRQHGFTAHRLPLDLAEWKALGLEVEPSANSNNGEK